MGVAVVVLFILVVIAALAFGGLWHYARSEKLKEHRLREKAEADKTRIEIADKEASQKTALVVAKTHQEELLTQARSATNVLTRLLADTTKLQNDAAALKTNDAGRQVALFPDLIAQARHFYETDLPELASREEIATKLDGARRIALQLVDAAGTAYEPTSDVRASVQSFITWAEYASKKTGQLRQVLSTIVSESKTKVADATATPNSLTLEAGMAKLAQAETEATQRLFAENNADATKQAAKIAADAESKKIVSDAERKRNEELAKEKEGADQQARDQALRDAQRKLENTKTQVAVQSTEEEARKIELRKKASDPAIQAKLAPFITPGYLQISGLSYDKKPFSYKEMQTYGALNQDFNGLDHLVAIAISASDKVRPRWKLNQKFYRRYPNQVEQVKEAQQLLIELGPVLVEMGLLQP